MAVKDDPPGSKGGVISGPRSVPKASLDNEEDTETAIETPYARDQKGRDEDDVGVGVHGTDAPEGAEDDGDEDDGNEGARNERAPCVSEHDAPLSVEPASIRRDSDRDHVTWLAGCVTDATQRRIDRRPASRAEWPARW